MVVFDGNCGKFNVLFEQINSIRKHGYIIHIDGIMIGFV